MSLDNTGSNSFVFVYEKDALTCTIKRVRAFREKRRGCITSLLSVFIPEKRLNFERPLVIMMIIIMLTIAGGGWPGLVWP